LSLNLYTYCANNPIKYEDSNGHAFTLVTGLIGAVAGLAIGAGSSMIADYFTGNLSKNNWKKYLGAGVQGAVVGGVAGLTGGLSLGVPAMIGTGAASGAVGNVLNQAIRNDGFKDFSKKELVVSTISSGVGFGVAGATSSGITNMTNQISSQTLQSTVQGATMGAIGGASGGFSANVTDQVWDIKTNKKDSFDVGSLIKDTFVGGVVGAGIGGAFGFGSSKFGTKINDLDKKVNESIKQGANKFVDSSKTMFKKLITDETGSIRIGLIDPKDSSSTGVGKTEIIKTSGMEEQLNYLEQNIPGFHRGQGQSILEYSFNPERNSSVTFGGSRIRGNFSPTSDLDVGFNNLTNSQAGRIIKNANKIEGGLPLEDKIKIVTGNETPNVPKIISPEEFFQRSGTRTIPDSRGSLEIIPSGSITVMPDGTIVKIPPGGEIPSGIINK